MSLKTELLSDREKAVLLARLAHTLTICARDTYEAGTDRVLEPEILRAYNELSHRVTGAVVSHLLGHEGHSLDFILEMIRDFGETRNRASEMKWAVDFAARKGTSLNDCKAKENSYQNEHEATSREMRRIFTGIILHEGYLVPQDTQLLP